MHSSQLWLQYNIPSDALDIKAEPEPDLSLISPPNSPFLSPTLTNSSLPTSVCRRRSYSLASPKQRVRPYPAQRVSRPTRTEDFTKMSNPHGYGWRGGAKPNERRSSDGDHPVYNVASITSVPYGTRNDPRQSTSSLHHAMGPDGASTSSPRQPMQMNMNPMSPMWPASAVMDATDPSMYPGVAGPYYPSDVNTSFDMRGQYKGSQSPEPQFTTQFTNPFPANPTFSPNANFQSTSTHYPSPNSGPSSTSPSDEFRRLQQKIQELEHQHEQDQDRIKMLESQLASRSYPSSRGSSPPVSPSFQAQWKARTEARVKIYCSLNRAGNALCAWHDSRRERRQFPPRNAPEGYLNCGCTYEEALFEESLASHSVGSYLPGDSVRMDPALRNPLLKLLEARYGYRDGDFERDPRTGDWLPGEGPAKWEQRLREGVTNPRRPRPVSDHERR